MEQEIKNFDRRIEQMMNEQQVAPPFGQWNRIAAELDAMPVAAGNAPATAIPKRGMYGFIVAALILGSSVTMGYLINSTNNKAPQTGNGTASKITTPATFTTTTVAAAPVTIAPVVKAEEPKHLTVKPVATKAVASIKKETSSVVAAPKTTVVTEKPAETSTSTVNENSEVPTPVQAPAATENQKTYYFPPVDIATPEKSDKEAAKAKGTNTDEASNDDDKDDKKLKFGAGSESKVKFHPKKRRKFNYGTIIRSK